MQHCYLVLLKALNRMFMSRVHRQCALHDATMLMVYYKTYRGRSGCTGSPWVLRACRQKADVAGSVRRLASRCLQDDTEAP